MPGYLIHLASCYPGSLSSQSFRLGVEAPDLLKGYYKRFGLEGARSKWESLRIPGIPRFDRFEKRVQQPELKGSTDGLHFGPSSSPDLTAFWNSLSLPEQYSPFWRGYLWHLATDKVFYKRLRIEELLKKKMATMQRGKKAYEKEVSQLHLYWDRTNSLVLSHYPHLFIPLELQELDVIHFVEDKNFRYISEIILLDTIDYLRKFDPLSDGIMNSIQFILEG